MPSPDSTVATMPVSVENLVWISVSKAAESTIVRSTLAVALPNERLNVPGTDEFSSVYKLFAQSSAASLAAPDDLVISGRPTTSTSAMRAVSASVAARLTTMVHEVPPSVTSKASFGALAASQVRMSSAEVPGNTTSVVGLPP